jgi:RNA polymerase sigma-70 factor (ECF subfamily)
VFAFSSNAAVSPAIFLAFANPETKQALTGSPGSLEMTPHFASKDEIDPAVIRRVAEGDSMAFERLYDAFSGILYSLALRMLERPEDTEELIQEVFTKIWNDAEHYDPRRGAPLAWAITITRHKAIDRIRATARRLRVYEAAEVEAKNNPPSVAQPALEAEQSESARAVRNSLETLPPEVRESIELAFFGGLSHSQIAEKLSVPVTTVKSRIRRAMMQLRQSLKPFT